MTIKLILPLQSSGKMEVTPQQSEILQTELFKTGYTPVIKENLSDYDYVFWMPVSIAFSNRIGLFTTSWEPLHLFDNHFKIED